MELLIKDGDYVPDGSGDLTALAGAEEVLQRVLFRLTARRGALPFLPELGSRLDRLMGERPSQREALAVQYAAQALQAEPDVALDGVEITQREGRLELRLSLRWQGRPLQLGLSLNEEGLLRKL